MRSRFNATGRPLRYVIVGGWNTAFGLGFFTLMYHLLGKSLGYVAILTIGQIVAVIQSHATQRVFVWRSTAKYHHELMRFSAVYVGSYVSNVLLLLLAVDGFGFPVVPSQWTIGLSILVPTFFIQRAWAFRARPAGPLSGIDGN